ncbi:hypothetical protein Ancab_022139 [Ancistrocladus abbreviatus]
MYSEELVTVANGQRGHELVWGGCRDGKSGSIKTAVLGGFFVNSDKVSIENSLARQGLDVQKKLVNLAMGILN